MDMKRLTNWARSAGRVAGFYSFLGRKAGRSRLFALLGLIPVALAVTVRLVMPGRGDDVTAVFNDIIMIFFLQFYIVIMALFFGTSICGEEVEGKTLPYIATRPVRRSAVIAGKYGAAFILQAVMVTVGLTASFVIMNAGRPASAGMGLFLRSWSALVLGVAAYTALFTFLGTLLKRSILIGLIFGLGWENAIQYFPGSTQKLSVAHYLKSLLPYQPPTGGGRLSFLLFRLEPTPAALAVLTLVLIAAIFLAAACVVFSVKEYRFDE